MTNDKCQRPSMSEDAACSICHLSLVIQYTPTVVVAAKPRNGRTPLTPSQGYFSQGLSLSPSSRSRKPGTKNSLVRVVSLILPVCPYSTTLLGSSKSTTSMTARG